MSGSYRESLSHISLSMDKLDSGSIWTALGHYFSNPISKMTAISQFSQEQSKKWDLEMDVNLISKRCWA